VRFRNIAGCVVVAVVASGAVAPAVAAPEREGCPGGHAFVATIVTLGGAVDARSAAGGTVPIAVGTPLCPGDGIAAGADRRVELRFAALDRTVGLSRSSSLKLPAADDSEANVEMLSGVMRFLSSVRQFFSVRTRHANAGIDGTEAVIAVDGPLADSLFVVQEGDVTLTARLDEQESVSLEAGQAGFVSQNVALTLASAANVPAKFRNLVADPAGAADWAIHFPPVLGSGAPAAARQAAARLAAGDPLTAPRCCLPGTKTLPRCRCARWWRCCATGPTKARTSLPGRWPSTRLWRLPMWRRATRCRPRAR